MTGGYVEASNGFGFICGSRLGDGNVIDSDGLDADQGCLQVEVAIVGVNDGGTLDRGEPGMAIRGECGFRMAAAGTVMEAQTIGHVEVRYRLCVRV